MPSQPCGRIRVQTVISPLPANRFYAGIKKKRGPKRKPLSELLRASKQGVENPYRSYTVSFKLRVLSYWAAAQTSCGRTKVREPTRIEVAKRFRIPATNLTRWRREEEQGKFTEMRGGQRRTVGVGRNRQWPGMKRELFEKFRERRALGRPVRRSWFRRVSKELFQKHYPSEGDTSNSFRFSNSWFRSYLSRHQISLRQITNKASQLPADFASAIISWLQFNRCNSQIRSEDHHIREGELTFPYVGRYRLQNICNMDQTPVPFEYLEGKTYNQIGEKTVWLQSSRSGWDKRQGTIQLTVFADGIPRVKPLLFFRGQGSGPTILAERRQYDNRVVVKFNPTTYANSSNMLEWLDEQLVPALEGQPTLLAIELFAGHKTEEVLDTFRAHDITPSVIPGGCTGLVQPLDVSINRPFKDILKVSQITLS